jgi:hypothetical protein
MMPDATPDDEDTAVEAATRELLGCLHEVLLRTDFPSRGS